MRNLIYILLTASLIKSIYIIMTTPPISHSHTMAALTGLCIVVGVISTEIAMRLKN